MALIDPRKVGALRGDTRATILRHRPMAPEDVETCVALIASHTVYGPRYGEHLAEMGPALLRVLESDAKSAVVWEQLTGTQTDVWGFGVTVFVGDGFIRDLKTPPHFWIGPELAARIVRGESPLLTYEELREANSRDGLNLVVWEGYFRPQDLHDPERVNLGMSAFVEDHRGYRWKEIIGSQIDSAERLQLSLNSGAMLWNPVSGRWEAPSSEAPAQILHKPFVIGLSRDRPQRQAGAWADSLFDYRPPRIGFAPSEQRLLTCALKGGTDVALSCELHVSLSTVKKTWQGIYNRVASTVPSLFPAVPKTASRDGDRGREKKQHLLAYLREHPEELRPIVRRLIQNTGENRRNEPRRIR